MSSGHDPEPRSGPNCTTSRCRCRSFSVSKKSPVVCDSGPRQSPQFQAQHLQGGVRLHTWTSQVKLIYLAGRDQRFIRMSLENFEKSSQVHESTWKYMKVLWSLKMIMIILNSFFYTVESTPEIWWFCTKAWNFDRNSRPRCTTSLKKISRFWGSAHWLAGSARFFLQASRRFPHGLFFAEKRWPKKRAEVVAKWWRNFPKKNPRLAASRSAMESPTERILNLLSANIWLQEISIFRDLSGLFGSLTCIVNHQTLPGSIVSLKAADKIFHCLSRQSRLTLDLEWFLIVSIHVSLMAHVFRVAMCVCGNAFGTWD